MVIHAISVIFFDIALYSVDKSPVQSCRKPVVWTGNLLKNVGQDVRWKKIGREVNFKIRDRDAKVKVTFTAMAAWPIKFVDGSKPGKKRKLKELENGQS